MSTPRSKPCGLRRIAVLALLATAPVPASALPLVMPRSALVAPPTAYIAEGERDLAPLAHIKFCMNNADECRSGGGAATEVVEIEQMPLLDQVNREVNRSIRPRAKHGVIGTWAVGPSSGDCNDYAVTKRHALIAQGVPASALRLAVVETSWGEGHLVLVARTRAGDQVLDNLSGRIKTWNETGHRFIKVQSSQDARAWAMIGTPRDMWEPETFDYAEESL